MSDIVEISRQIGILQHMMQQEEEQHRQIMQELEAMREQIQQHNETITGLSEREIDSGNATLVADINRILDIIRRRSAIAVALAGVSGLIIGGASASEIGAALKNILMAMTQ